MVVGKIAQKFVVLSFLLGTIGNAVATPARLILPGDLLEINCAENSSLCVQRTVNSDGMILLPILGAVGVATLDIPHATQKLVDMLREDGILANPTIQIKSRFFRGACITVEGAVHNRISLRFSKPPRLSSLLILAQPESPNETLSVSISHADGSSTEYPSVPDILLSDGDRVLVNSLVGNRSVVVVGGVSRPSQLDFKDGLTLGSAIGQAGGIGGRGQGGRIVILRGGEPIPVDLPDKQNFALRPGDIVKVEVNQDVKHAFVDGAVIHEGLVDLVGEMKVSQVIEACGGLRTIGKDVDTILLTRFAQKRRSKPIRLSFRMIKSGRQVDPFVYENDRVTVHGSDLKSNK